MDQFVRVKSESGVRRVSLTRSAKRNALNRQLLSELLAAISAAKQDNHVRVLVMDAEGPVFCAGMDLGEMQARASSPSAAQEWHRDSQEYAAILQSLFELPFPTVAMVQGPAVAGGVGLAVACDFVVASENATFSLPEPMRGIVAAMVTPLLIHRVGFGAATQLLLSGETCSAADALRIGLCHDVVAPDQLAERVDRLIASIQQCAPEALAQTKSFLHQCRPTALIEEIRRASQISAAARESDAAREGLQAFLEKRPPKWQP